MIPKDYITAWRAQAPWRLDAQVEQDLVITRAQFEENLAGKRKQPDFRDDIGTLLRPGLSWDFDEAMDAVLANLVARLPGEPWRGEEHPATT